MRGRYPEIGTLSQGETQPKIRQQSQQHTLRELADPVPTAGIFNAVRKPVAR